MSMELWQREFLKTIEERRAQGWGWRWDGLQDWTTDAIFAQLRELGIDTDEQRFPQQAAAAGRCKALDDEWDSQLCDEKKNTGFWQDFPLHAVPLLWERLTPNLICADIIDERLYRVIKADEENERLPGIDGIPADVRAVVGLARYLQGFPPAER